MSACNKPIAGAPLIQLTLIGSGESLLRMEKRLACAAAGLGLTLGLDIRKDGEVLAPVVLKDEQLVLTGLQQTEEIERWFRQIFPGTNDG